MSDVNAINPATSQPKPTLIGSVQRAMRLLALLHEYPDGVTAKTLIRRAGLRRATAYHLLRTLAHDGYVESGSGMWRLVGCPAQHQPEAEQAEAVIERVRAVLATFDKRGVVTSDYVNWDIPTPGEVLRAIQDALDQPDHTEEAL